MKKRIKKIIKDNKRVLVGLAHHDKGVKQKDCDCCYCNSDIIKKGE